MDIANFTFLAVIVLVATTLLLLLASDWRIGISALGLQYVAVFVLVVLVWPLEMAVIKLVAGWVAAAMVGVEMVSSPQKLATWVEKYFSSKIFRVVLAVLIGITVFSIAPGAARWMLSASYEQLVGSFLLMGMGILSLSVNPNPYHTTLGLLTFFAGFEIIFATIDASSFSAGIFAGLNLAIAFVGAYLIALSDLEPEQ